VLERLQELGFKEPIMDELSKAVSGLEQER
jgi:hypothetical protein